jgi:L-malate glycosyltransferase
VRVLFVNHTSHVSGGERSLLDLVESLPPSVEPVAACPPGPLADRLKAADVDVAAIPGTDGSLKLHAWHTARGATRVGTAARRLRRIVRAVDPDVVHANTIRSGLICAPVALLGGPPLVTYVRDCLPPGRFAALALRAVDRASTTVVSNSAHTRASLGVESARSRRMVVHSPVDLRRFDPAQAGRQSARMSLGLEPGAVALGVVAQLTPWKGQDDAIRIVAGLRELGIDARLLLAGSAKFVSGATRHDNLAYVRRLEALAAEKGLGGAVRFLGEQEDVPALLSALDLLLVPSWEEPFGRVVVEAMAMGIPVAATSVGGPAETITPGLDGVLLPPRRPSAWTERLAELIRDRTELARLGSRGRRRAADFSTDAHVEAMLRVYGGACERSGRHVGDGRLASSHAQ